MRKRRRLADKLTIMVCAVLVAVSAFFYAPMEVNAESITFSNSSSNTCETNALKHAISNHLDKSLYVESLSGLTSGKYYIIDYSGSSVNNIGSRFYMYSHSVSVDFGGVQLSLFNLDAPITSLSNTFSFDFSGSFVYKAVEDLSLTYDVYSIYGYTSSVNTVVTFNDNNIFTFNIDNITEIHTGGDNYEDGYEDGYQAGLVAGNESGYDSGFSDGVNSVDTDSYYQSGYNAGYSAGLQESYQNGYNAGYSAGEEAGYGNGYSQGFADGESSVDTNEIYNQGFDAGKESVDTQSYYDAGYDAGYQLGAQESYDIGYQDGYQSAMDRIEGWGADTSDYPILVYDNSFSNLKLFCDVKTGYPQVSYGDYYFPQFNFTVDPNHTYKVVFNSSQYSYSSAYFSGSQRADLVYNMGVLELPWNVGESFSFIQGSSFTSNVRLQCYIYSSISDGSSSGQAVITLNSLNVKVYDYGPSGNTQNHISNQTDQLTGGYNDSQGNSVNNDFSLGLNEFETAEDSLFATATTGMKDFTFFDLSSVPAMLTGMSFVGSVMTGWFNQAGGTSGVGIVLSILFSIMLVAMVLGLYRWYQSKGGKD